MAPGPAAHGDASRRRSPPRTPPGRRCPRLRRSRRTARVRRGRVGQGRSSRQAAPPAFPVTTAWKSASPVVPSGVLSPTPAAWTTPAQRMFGRDAGQHARHSRPVGGVAGHHRHLSAARLQLRDQVARRPAPPCLCARSGRHAARPRPTSHRATTAPSAPVPPVTSTVPAAHQVLSPRFGPVTARLRRRPETPAERTATWSSGPVSTPRQPVRRATVPAGRRRPPAHPTDRAVRGRPPRPGPTPAPDRGRSPRRRGRPPPQVTHQTGVRRSHGDERVDQRQRRDGTGVARRQGEERPAPPAGSGHLPRRRPTPLASITARTTCAPARSTAAR